MTHGSLAVDIYIAEMEDNALIEDSRRFRDLIFDEIDARASLDMRLTWTFYGDSEPNHVSDEDYMDAVDRFMEWACFFATLPNQTSTLAERTLDQLEDASLPSDRQTLRAFIKPEYSLYQVITTGDDEMIFEDQIDKRRFTVAGADFKLNEFVLTALYPLRDKWTLGLIQKKWTESPGDVSGIAGERPLHLEQLLFDAGTSWILDAGHDDVLTVYEQFQYTTATGDERLPTVDELWELISSSDSAAVVIQESTKMWNPWSHVETDLLANMISSLYKARGARAILQQWSKMGFSQRRQWLN